MKVVNFLNNNSLWGTLFRYNNAYVNMLLRWRLTEAVIIVDCQSLNLSVLSV